MNWKARHGCEHGHARIIILALAFCLVVLATGVFWSNGTLKRKSTEASSVADSEQVSPLSDSTRTVLKRLDSPIQIRFYALLDPASVPGSMQAFAERVDQLLFKYQRESGGKIEVTRYNSRSDIKAAAVSAAADGFKPFNLDKGDACYFGLAIGQDGRTELLSQLAPEWQQALESDLTRAIEHVVRAKGPAPRLANTPPATLDATEEVKRALPNFASVSMEQGTRILRGAALEDFKATVAAMEIHIAEAERSLSQAQSAGSEAEQRAATKKLQQVQSEQTEKLKQIAARSAAQVEALRQLKGTGH
jgi:hypothetical protein